MRNSEKQTNFAIRSKLISAAAMLVVAAVMVVSSTYAWFTLSTAPEVKGVSTAVGANGALEMLLASWDEEAGTFKYGTGSVSGKTTTERNGYWGNLVDLSDTSYGSQAITLYPSKINLNADGKLNLLAPLQTPEFGSDGRVETLAAGGAFARWNGANFVEQANYYGFRGLGVASGLTERQQAFRTAVSAMSTAAYNAQTEARRSLSANGTALANIAIAKAMNGPSDKVFDQDDVNAITSMVNGLDIALTQVEQSYIQAILVYALGTSIDHASDTEALALAAAITSAANSAPAVLDSKLEAVFTALGTAGADADVVKTALVGYNTYKSAVGDVAAAKTALESITTASEYAWTDISGALTSLVNVDNITINNIPAGEVTQPDNKNQIAGDILGGKGVKVSMPTGGGVYADVADLSGDYTVDIEIDSTSLNVGVDGLLIKATMTADSTEAKPFLTVVSEALNDASKQPIKGEGETLPLTELYGYVIDLAFKTNAPQSNLLLQTEAKDRIYTENNNESTMGSGSTMTFKSSSPDFTSTQVKNLMSNIRVVFYSTLGASNMADVYATAKLDLETGVTEDANGITAKLYIYKSATATKATKTVNSEPVTLYKVNDKYYSSTSCTPATEVTDTTGITDLTETVTVEVRDDVITALNQNEAKHISALVYLDGESITNSDVAATAATSITGTVNFQFASSAELVPMEYGELHTMN